MIESFSHLISTHNGDAEAFLEKVRALTVGIVRDCKPTRLYLVRIDNWFGPLWLDFSGKQLGAFGVWRTKTKTIPPFVPHRVVEERMLLAPEYLESAHDFPLHIECSGGQAFQRKLSEFPDGAFIWFSSESETQTRGSVMVYRPWSSHRSSFYASWAKTEAGWEISRMRGVSRNELLYLEERGSAVEEVFVHA